MTDSDCMRPFAGRSSPLRRIPYLLLALISALLTALPAHAEDEADADEAFPVALRGFLTAGLTANTAANANFVRDASQATGVGRSGSLRNDSLVGLQASYRPFQATELVLQAVSRDRYGHGFAPELTQAFVKYDVSPRLSFRAGRIGTEFLAFADSKMVGYSYLPVRPPVDYFGGTPVNYADGLDAQVRWPLGDGVLRAGTMVGLGAEKIRDYDLTGTKIFVGSLGYETGFWLFRYIHAQSRFSHDLASAAQLRDTLTALGAASAAQSLKYEGTMERYQSISISYDDGDWQVQAAMDRIRHETPFYQNSHAAYLLAGRRLGSVTPFVGYSRAKSEAKPFDTGLSGAPFEPLNAMIAEALSQTHQDRSTWSLGTRWDFARNMDLKLQADFIRGSPSSTLLATDVKPGWNGQMNIFSLTFDYVF